jgi:2-dehydropantoate 2-reductase
MSYTSFLAYYLIDLNDKVGPHFPSMYQDLINNNRRTEIDYINGAVARRLLLIKS